MQGEKSLERTYDECVADGFLKNLENVDIEKITANLQISESDYLSSKTLLKTKAWNSIYKLTYDVLHVLVESFLMFDNIKSFNHQCLFAYLCQKHPELEFDWNFFERIRMRRNGINYYGKMVDESMFKEDALQFELYISLLKKEILKRLKE